MRIGSPVLRCALCLLSLAVSSPAKNGSEPLDHYSLTALPDSAIGARLMGRFKAKGQPVFLIHDANLGLAQGDIMRFQDKAVLVDADVWQTLREEGALDRLKAAPVLRVQAHAVSATWEARAGLVENPRERKAYAFGSELLKILEQTFGGIPTRQQMVLVFEGANLVLMAPDEFMDRLQFAEVRRAPKPGKPRILSPPPSRAFAGKPMHWQAWAADPSEPSGALRYALSGKLPAGMAWDAGEHTLRGAPTDTGLWPLTLEVRNAAGASEVSAFALEVRADAPPRLAQGPKPVVVAGEAWTFGAAAVDPDHEGGRLRIRPLQMPAGMEFDSLDNTFRWQPADSLAGTKASLSVRVTDPEGAASDTAFSLAVIPAAEMLWSEGIRPALPWDTLKQGRTYIWEAGASALAWAQQGIVLSEAKGSDFTRLAGDSLVLIPLHPGLHTLVFAFDVQGKRVETRVTLPVKPDSPPRFRSEVGAWRVRAGQPASYRPVAVDVDGDPVSVRTAETPAEGLSWDGERLLLVTEKPGYYTARLIASDPAGHASDQWAAFKVEPAERPTAWFLENRIEAGLSTWNLTADFGTGRMGLYMPALDRLGVKGPSGARSWPYITFGGNLLGREAEIRGNRLWADAGITFRAPSAKVATGGVMGRLAGEWTLPGRALGRIEFEMQGHVNQAIVVADTSRLHVIYGNDVLRFENDFNDIVSGIIEEATAKDNMALFTRLEGWSRLGAGFWAGPGIWREDLPNANRFRQIFGGGLRYQIRLDQALAVNSLRLGWGAGAGWSLYWTGRISIFSPM